MTATVINLRDYAPRRASAAPPPGRDAEVIVLPVIRVERYLGNGQIAGQSRRRTSLLGEP